MTGTTNDERLMYAAPSSFVDSSFFVELSRLKLNVLKLDTSYQQIVGYYNYNSLSQNQNPALNLRDSSLKSISDLTEVLPKHSYFLSNGKLLNVNSIEEFKNLNKKDLLTESAMTIFNGIKDKSFLSNPQLLSSFTILSYCDLKKYSFYYWFAFPQFQSNWLKIDMSHSINYRFDRSQSFTEQFYILNETDDELIPISKLLGYSSTDKCKILFVDTCSLEYTVSFILRNFLFALSYYNFKNVEFQVLKVNHPSFNFTINLENEDYNSGIFDNPSYIPPISGWERTSRGKLGPKVADLGALIDPLQLANQAIDLNLQLMKWRLVPELNLLSVKNSKVLILGSGTLGSYIGRCLLAWGVRKITFVDNGKVSFSNPVRQPLYNYEDCLNGGSSKAETAAVNMKKIFPLVDATGHSLHIPMIGHPIKDEEKEFNDYNKLLKLYEEHDAVFLCLDSREARWLPTLLGNAMDKIVINSALGFESYLVMRHGCIDSKKGINEQVDGRLGCYFCNDIVAPKNSMTDRTLDQMCTVTRPGVALMASSLATELFVSILQTPNGNYSKHIVNDRSNILGSLPHQIRGFLHNFEILKVSSDNFKYCTACSVKVVEEFHNSGWEFIKKSLNEETYLENLTGLKAFHERAEEAAFIMDDYDDESGLEDNID